MQKVIAITAVFCVMSTQGCTTNNHTHHHYPANKMEGIVATPPGAVGKPGMQKPVTPQAQRKADIEKSMSGGTKGPGGSLSPSQAMAGQPPKDKDADSFSKEAYWAGIFKDSIQTIIKVCIPIKCFD